VSPIAGEPQGIRTVLISDGAVGLDTTRIYRDAYDKPAPISDQRPAAPQVRLFLQHLQAVGFTAAPRFDGLDEHGREVLNFSMELSHPTWLIDDARDLVDPDGGRPW
jgi:hypothetical protein